MCVCVEGRERVMQSNSFWFPLTNATLQPPHLHKTCKSRWCTIVPFKSPLFLAHLVLKTSGDLQTSKTCILKIICGRIPRLIHWFSYSAHLVPTGINESPHVYNIKSHNPLHRTITRDLHPQQAYLILL